MSHKGVQSPEKATVCQFLESEHYSNIKGSQQRAEGPCGFVVEYLLSIQDPGFKSLPLGKKNI